MWLGYFNQRKTMFSLFNDIGTSMKEEWERQREWHKKRLLSLKRKAKREGMRSNIGGIKEEMMMHQLAINNLTAQIIRLNGVNFF